MCRMPHAVNLAINLDDEMLTIRGIKVHPFTTPDTALPHRPDLADELAGRFLIKYVREPDVQRYSIMSGVTHFPGVHFVTPTVLCAEVLQAALHLPPVRPFPKYALVLDPAKLEAYGPRRIRGGQGVEYLLLNGFSVDAIVPPGWPRKID